MSQKAVAIVQSNYIPWKGYFDLIARVDEFILYDDVQYTRRDWRNRNRIKTPSGVQWLTIPVHVKGKYLQRISETEVSDPDWSRRHWQTLVLNYSRAANFRQYAEVFEELYRSLASTSLLSEINLTFIAAINGVLDITTRISTCADYRLVEGKTERLVELCKQAGATRYVSGPAARAYMNESLFAAEGIEVEYMEYQGYPEYPQLYPPFVHEVSVLDLIFNTGPHARQFIVCS